MMQKNSFNLKQLRTASNTTGNRPTQFRLSDEVVFSSSGKHTDAYRVVLTAKRLRDRFMVSLAMTHEPSQSIVHSDSWIFTTMERCWEKYYTIRDIVESTRDFIETEGIKTVVAQFVVRHNLTGISSDIEDIYQTAIPYIRPTIDNASGGNLLHNFPTIPGISQAGPDTMDDVYRTVGSSANPLPPSGQQHFIYKHKRNEMGLKDVAPKPMSGFQAAAYGAGIPMGRTASSNKQVKTAAAPESPIRAFLARVEQGSSDSVSRGRKEAIDHYRKATGAPEDEAQKFYNAIRNFSADDRLILELPAEELIRFLAEGVYVPEGFDGRTYNASKTREITNALALGFMPVRALVRRHPSVSDGHFGLILKKPSDVAYFSGNLERLRNPTRADYIENPSGCLYAPKDLSECRAASIIKAMPMTELVSGPFRILEDMTDAPREYGHTEALIFSAITPAMVQEIVVENEEDEARAHRILDKLEKIMPVTSRDSISIVDNGDRGEEPEQMVKPSAVQSHFQVSDRVAMKPRFNNPSLQGSIADISDAKVTVQWDGGDRHVYDMAEALMRLVTQPGSAQPVKGAVVYSLPGMSDATVDVLNSVGLDPVTIHSIASHAMPVSDKAKGWGEVLQKSFQEFGVALRRMSGYVFTGERKAFAPKEWYEGRLPEGGRLVIDMSPNSIRIEAGVADDYVVPARPIIFE